MELATAFRLKQNLVITRVDPLKIIRTIIQGTFKPCIEKISVQVKEIIPDIPIGPDNTFEVYEVINSNNKKLRVFTVNHVAYSRAKEGFEKYGKYSDSYLKELGLKCDWCRQPYSDIPWQMPIRLDSLSEESVYVFHGEGSYCSEQCMYADYRALIRERSSREGPTYRETYTLIKLLRQLRSKYITGDVDAEGAEDDLIAAPHWKLLCHNGGPLTEYDFYKNKKVYTETPNIVFLPTKRQYYTYK
jgi:hypothetical protein